MKLIPIESFDSPQGKLAMHIAVELVRDGHDSVSALPIAIGILGAIQKVIDSGSIEDGIDDIINSWKKSDEWWLTYHPNTERAQKIKEQNLPGMAKSCTPLY